MAAETSRKKHLRVADRPPGAGISESEAHPDEVRMTIRDVVEAWFSMNPEPKHFRVAGRTYADFVHSCCQFLLARAMRQGITSTDAIVGSEDRRHIEAFLGRGKALWDKRCQEEQAEVDARRRAKEKHQLEEKRQVEESEIQRQARLPQEDNRRLEEAQKQAEARRRSEEQRVAEVQRQRESKQEALRQAELATHNNEQVRIDQVFFKHHQVVANEGIRLQAGLCSGIEYYAFVLRDRIERSAEILFDSASQPSYDILRKNPELLNRLKGLSFGDDRHPSCYQDPYVNAYYALRYELGYAFEYSQIYGLLLSVMRQEKESQPFDVISIGSGQGLDYWSLRYALARQREHRLRIGWHGIDSEIWPDHVLEDDVAQYSDGTDICDVLGGMDSLEAKVLMFPKVISELSGEVIRCIVSWLERVTFTRDVHYLCFAHTERKSLDPSGDKQKETGACFRYPADSLLDAVKSAALIGAARNGASKQFYSCEANWCIPGTLSVSYYDVAWPGAQAGVEWRDTYPYLTYGSCDMPVGGFDPIFEMDKGLRNAVRDIGRACCKEFASSGDGKDCDARCASFSDSSQCPLYKYPRFKTGGMAYQIVRLVNDIPF